ncbi:hypothetical protein [Streptomyces sp. PA5.6]|uniref:hypothetical protein n=1 Tax=Streptomyces sp. PA5.6 TaxID=3035651 RepID=UPI003904BCD1
MVSREPELQGDDLTPCPCGEDGSTQEGLKGFITPTWCFALATLLGSVATVITAIRG